MKSLVRRCAINRLLQRQGSNECLRSGTMIPQTSLFDGPGRGLTKSVLKTRSVFCLLSLTARHFRITRGHVISLCGLLRTNASACAHFTLSSLAKTWSLPRIPTPYVLVILLTMNSILRTRSLPLGMGSERVSLTAARRHECGWDMWVTHIKEGTGASHYLNESGKACA